MVDIEAHRMPPQQAPPEPQETSSPPAAKDKQPAAAPATTPAGLPAPGGPFLRGPIPLDWLGVAARLPGKALHVGLLAWYRAYLTKQATVYIPTKIEREWGVSRHAAYRAVESLEEAGLVVVDRQQGKRARLTIREAPQGGGKDG